MNRRQWLLFLKCCLLIQSALCTKYKVLYEIPEIFESCSEYPNNGVELFVDMTYINRTFLSDGSIYVGGYSTILNDELKGEEVAFTADGYKKIRGQWVNTVFTYKRKRFCDSILDTKEFWHNSIKNMTYEGPLCPFHKGLVLNFDSYVDLYLNMPGNTYEGEYRFDITLKYGKNPATFICLRSRVQMVLA